MPADRLRSRLANSLVALCGCLGSAIAIGQELLPPPAPLAVGPDAAIIQGPVLEDPTINGGTPSFWAAEDPSAAWFGQDWFNPTLWDGSFEIGINATQGNSETLSLRTGFEASRETEKMNWDIQFTYAKTEANNVETQHNSLLLSDWDFKLENPRWSWFNKLGLEYDEFKNFDLRLFLNTGLGYLLVDNEITQLRGRLGSGTSREFGGVDEQWKPEADFGADFNHQLTPRQKLSILFDYFPTWDDFSDYRLITNASWEMVLDETSNLSLKLLVIDRYDSTPNGAQPNDVDYALLLLWKM